MSKRTLAEVAELKAELTAMEYPTLKAKLKELGVSEVFKGGVKKSTIIQNALRALEELENKEELEVTTTEEIEETSEEVSEETSEEEEETSEEEEEEEEEENVDDIEVDSPEIVIQKSDSKQEISQDEGEQEDTDDEEEEESEIDSFEKTVSENKIEKIDETKFTLEELLENEEITNCLIPQSIPSTRVILLNKLQAIQEAIQRKQK